MNVTNLRRCPSLSPGGSSAGAERPDRRADRQSRHAGGDRLLVDSPLSEGVPLRPPGHRDAAPVLAADPRVHSVDAAARQRARLRVDLEQGAERGAAEDDHPFAERKARPRARRSGARASWSTGRCATARRRSPSGSRRFRPRAATAFSSFRSIRNIAPPRPRPSATRPSRRWRRCAGSRASGRGALLRRSGLYRRARQLRSAPASRSLDFEPEVVLASYHGIPQAYFDKGDPYYCHCAKTTRLLGEALELDEERLQMTFQSRFGRAEWLKPYTAETVRELASARRQTRGRRHARIRRRLPGDARGDRRRERGLFSRGRRRTLRRHAVPQRQRRRRRGHRSGRAARIEGVGWVSPAERDQTRALCRFGSRNTEPGPRSLGDLVLGARRLIVERRARQMAAFERVQGRRVGHVEGIEAAAQHERDFVDQHVADRPQFAAKPVPVAQEPGVGKRAPVGKFGECKRDQRAIGEVGEMRLGVRAGLDRDADGRSA